VSRSGDKQLRDANVYCGRGSTLLRSIGNEVFVALSSSVRTPATFQCVFKSLALSDSNCDCGWNVRSKIVGGSEAAPNEFVSHVGLVDRNTRSVFCGGSICK
jgi:secreted trypsin-like serine protease